jgi:iron complex transport system substrate-binding protein
VRIVKRKLFILLFIVIAASSAWLGGSGASGDTQPGVRVITCGKAHYLVLDALYMFPEASEAVVAFGASSQVGGNFIQLLDPDAQKRAVLAPEPGVEEILAHSPDAVVLKSYLKNGLGRQLEALNVSVLYVDLESPEQFRRDIAAIGQLFGNPRRAEALNRFYAENLQEVQTMSREIAEAQKPETLFLYYGVRSATTSFNVPPRQWLQTRLVQWAGGKPVWFEAAAGSGWQQIGFEQIAAWNPEVILLVSYHTPVDEVKKTLLSDPKWLELEAVKKGNLLAFPSDYLSWDQPDPRWILGLNWLARKLHPDSFPSPGSPSAEMEKKVVEFYSFAFGLPAERIEEQILPMIHGDYP